jgi:hypothetical protein
MSKKIRIPSYRLHKGSSQAVVVLNGRSVYLGVWDSPESHAKYERTVAEWLAARPGSVGGGNTSAELAQERFNTAGTSELPGHDGHPWERSMSDGNDPRGHCRRCHPAPPAADAVEFLLVAAGPTSHDGLRPHLARLPATAPRGRATPAAREPLRRPVPGGLLECRPGPRGHPGAGLWPSDAAVAGRDALRVCRPRLAGGGLQATAGRRGTQRGDHRARRALRGPGQQAADQLPLRVCEVRRLASGLAPALRLRARASGQHTLTPQGCSLLP